MSRRVSVATLAFVLLWVSIATGQNRYSSPRIESLRSQVADGDYNVEPFWRRVSQEGTPLLEPFDGDERYSLVTFVWRGSPATRNVAVVATIMKAPLEAMTRLEGTDVWYATAKVPLGARFAYWLSVNSPMVTEGPGVAEQLATLQADPLNPHRWLCGPDGGLFQCRSMVELPGATPQPWIVPRANTPSGKIDKYTLKSERLGNERSLSVYAPAGYTREGPPAALLLLFDEGAYLSAVPTPVILDNLIAASRIPRTVAVLIGNPNAETRSKELRPNRVFADFLAAELVPWIHAHYNVTNDPKQTIVAGSSLGGLAAAFAALRHPEVFGNVLSQSGDFSWAPDHVHEMGRLADATTETGWLAKEFIKSPKLSLKFYIDAGVFEVDQASTGGNVLETSRHMRDVLLAKGYEVHYQQFVGGHDYLSWRGTLADALIALIGSNQP